MPTAATGLEFGWEMMSGSKTYLKFIAHQHPGPAIFERWGKKLLDWMMRMQREVVKGSFHDHELDDENAKGSGGRCLSGWWGQQEQGTILDNAAALGV